MNLRARQPPRGWLGPAIAAIVLAGGCGGASSPIASTGARPSSHSAGSPSRRPATRDHRPNNGSSPGAQTIPSPAPTGMLAAAASVRVIRAWSNALRRGDVRAAARYFALPSEMINGPDPAGNMILVRINTLGEAVAANASLPCGAKFLSADQRGRYVNALFQLTDRPGPGGGCGAGAGQTARTNLIVRNGLIVEWIRAPDDPGDNGTPPPGGSGPPTASPAA